MKYEIPHRRRHGKSDMCLGEGTGAVAYLPVLDLAAEVYGRMSTFSENDIEDYKELGEKE